MKDLKKGDASIVMSLITGERWFTASTVINSGSFKNEDLIDFFEATLAKQPQSARILYNNIINKQAENLSLNIDSNYHRFLTTIINKTSKNLLAVSMEKNYPQQQASVSQPSPVKEVAEDVIKVAGSPLKTAEHQAGAPAKAGKEESADLNEEIEKLNKFLDLQVAKHSEEHALIATKAVAERRKSLCLPSRLTPVAAPARDMGRRASISGMSTTSTSSMMTALNSEKKPATSVPNRRASISGPTPTPTSTSSAPAPTFLRRTSVPVFHTPANKASGALTLTRTASSGTPALSTKRAAEPETNLPAKKPASVRAAAALGSFFGKTPAKTTSSTSSTSSVTPKR